MTWVVIFIVSMIILSSFIKRLLFLSPEKKKIEKRFFDVAWRSENWYIEKKIEIENIVCPDCLNEDEVNLFYYHKGQALKWLRARKTEQERLQKKLSETFLIGVVFENPEDYLDDLKRDVDFVGFCNDYVENQINILLTLENKYTFLILL